MVQLEDWAILVSAGESQLPYRSSLASLKTEDMEFVEVFDSPGKGRGLRAIKEVWAGDVLFAEPPFASVVFDNYAASICHGCFRRQEKLQRCGQCRFAQYCDKTCQRAAWEEHKLECGAVKSYGKVPNENVRLAARILWRMDKEGSVVSDMQLTPLEELEDHIYDISEEDIKDFKVDIHNFLDYWPRSSKPHTVDSVSHILGVINCNGFMVSDQRGLQAVGVGLFPNLCLVNHDCWPNCTVILNNGNQSAVDTMYHSQTRIELRALGKIEPGEEVTVSYVDFLNLSEDRRRLLKQQYFFDCTCEHCTNKTKDFKKLYRPNNAQLGMATMRAGVTHWQAGYIEVAHGMICKAYAILMITHGPIHPITKDLEAMRMQTEMELRMFKQNEYVYHSMREAALKNQPMRMMAEPATDSIKNLFRRK
ncbi:histone-lysine N-methyltransferase SMYD1-like [Garra rufa]|uniref:histone-lysine N-methyltransferase SMYD1-like n=1 Tax=Garra rufa TaxID=137080 RepID=UPI003CCE606A